MTSRDRLLMRLCQRFAHATIANCEACRQSVIEQEGARPERVYVIPNGIDLSRFVHIPPYQPKMNGELERVGVVANLRSVKGIDIFIRRPGIGGGGVSECAVPHRRRRLPVPYRKLAEECGVAEKVQFPARSKTFPPSSPQLDVAVLPSRAEGLSNALLEYMAAGRPIVAHCSGREFGGYRS